MKQQLEEDYIKIGLGILAALLIAGLAFTMAQNTDKSPEDTVKDSTQTQNSSELLPETNSNKTTVYFFWGDGCPYCAEEKPFLEELDRKHEDLEVKMYEVYYNKTNQKIYQNVAEKYSTSAKGVPATFIGQESWGGFREETIGKEIESKIEECLEDSCTSPLE